MNLPHYLSHHKQNPAPAPQKRNLSRPGGIARFRVSRQIYEIYTLIQRFGRG